MGLGSLSQREFDLLRVLARLGHSLPLQAKLLEHNVRFGDPECQGLMARLDSDLLAALIQVCGGRARLSRKDTDAPAVAA